jgi:hypothetical protein
MVVKYSFSDKIPDLTLLSSSMCPLNVNFGKIPDSEQKTHVDAHGPDVGACLAAYPEDSEAFFCVELDELAFVDGPDPQLPLDGGDCGGPLENRASQILNCLGELILAGNFAVQTHNTDVLFTGLLLGLDEPGGPVDADDEAAWG